MSDLVERLAKRAWEDDPQDFDTPEAEARWWLNAIADELDANAERFTSSKLYGGSQGMRFSADYLRKEE